MGDKNAQARTINFDELSKMSHDLLSFANRLHTEVFNVEDRFYKAIESGENPIMETQATEQTIESPDLKEFRENAVAVFDEFTYKLDALAEYVGKIEPDFPNDRGSDMWCIGQLVEALSESRKPVYDVLLNQ